MTRHQASPLQVVVKYCDSRSGGEGAAYRFCQYLKEQKQAFIMVCGKDKEKKKGKHELAEHVVELGMLRPGRLLKYGSFFRRAEQYLATNKGLAFSFERVRGAHVLRLAGAHACFLQQSLEGLSVQEKRKKERARSWDIYNKYAVWQERRAIEYPTVKRIIVPSYMNKHDLHSLYPEQSSIVSVIHNGIDTKRFQPAQGPEREEARAHFCQELLADGTKRVVGFAGNVFQRKGLSHCIESLARLPDDVVLLVAGADNKEPYLQQAQSLGVAQRIRFLGHITNMPRFFHALDVFCLPSRNDPFGFVIAESVAAGVPVVTTANAGGAEILRQGYSGMVCSQLDSEAVAKAIAETLVLDTHGIAATAPSATDMYAHYLAVAEDAHSAL